MLRCESDEIEQSVATTLVVKLNFRRTLMASQTTTALSSFFLPHLVLLCLHPHSSTPLVFPTLSSFLPCPREHCDWVNRAALCGVCSVCHYPCGRRVE